MDLQEQQHFDRVAREDGAAVWWYNTPAGQSRLAHRARRIVEGYGPAPARVLELGCGEGAFTRHIAERLAPETCLVTVELSWELLRLFVQARNGNAARLHLLNADAERLPFATGTFDAIIGNAILHHVCIKRVIPECLRVLRPGGYFVFIEPNLLNPLIFLIKRVPWLKRFFHESPRETAFLRWALRRDLTQLGLSAVTVDPWDFVLPVMPSWLVPSSHWVSHRLTRIGVIREFAFSLFIGGRKDG